MRGRSLGSFSWDRFTPFLLIAIVHGHDNLWHMVAVEVNFLFICMIPMTMPWIDRRIAECTNNAFQSDHLQQLLMYRSHVPFATASTLHDPFSF